MIVIFCIGVIYNRIGLLFQAMDASFGRADSVMGRVAVSQSFVPAALGFGYAMVAIVAALL